ncbi:unnamed protein product [Onchocerca ochengi]|uniref:DUF3800 domain-containing protein n=1 Tax=Onchocerca ochengi TaxID=42157 RepID=A0A182ENS5_ONCOC|nr:unnamed protein product [Onchocerca ochengi]
MCRPERNDRNAVLHIDEIAQYQAGKYISSNEAVWRILSFTIHERNPAVVHLAVHLENGKRVYFTAANSPTTALVAFFTLCQNDPFAKTLLYSEVPSYYTWSASRKSFQRYKRREPVDGHLGIFKQTTIGRLYTVHLNQDEYFFLRMLLIVWDECTMAHKKSLEALDRSLSHLQVSRHYCEVDEAVNYMTEFLDSLDLPEMPPHVLQLKNDLETDCFSHGKLYVVCSRVGKPDNLYIYIDNETTNFIPASIVKLSILDVGGN